MNLSNRIKRIESALQFRKTEIKPLFKRPKLTRDEWIEKVSLSMAGMNCIEASKTVLAKRDDGDAAANSIYWDELEIARGE